MSERMSDEDDGAHVHDEASGERIGPDAETRHGRQGDSPDRTESIRGLVLRTEFVTKR